MQNLVRVLPRGSAADDRALLVSAVAELTGTDAADVSVERRCGHCGGDDHGRPVVTGPGHPLVWVSLSRAGGLVAVVATTTGPVGIDIESLERVAVAGFDDVAFADAERATLATDRDRAALWTAKEAILKARGTGLRVDPRTVDVANPADGIRLLSVNAPDGYVATVAYGSSSSGTAAE